MKVKNPEMSGSQNKRFLWHNKFCLLKKRLISKNNRANRLLGYDFIFSRSFTLSFTNEQILEIIYLHVTNITDVSMHINTTKWYILLTAIIVETSMVNNGIYIS